jgi:YjbE family integral membrane protein
VDHAFWVALVNIVIIDLVLSGDNAVVIAMAVQHLPARIARRAAIVGAAGAVGLRVVFTAAASVLLAVPYLQAVGGLVLFWIAYQLLIEEEEDVHAGKEVHDFGEAVRMIILADLVMSLDNILAVGGAAHNNMGLLLFGLGLSIPLVLFGSSLLTTLLKKWPALNYVGSGILAWTAGHMVVQDTIVEKWITSSHVTMLNTLVPAFGLVAVLGLGYWQGHKREAKALGPASEPEHVEPSEGP